MKEERYKRCGSLAQLAADLGPTPPEGGGSHSKQLFKETGCPKTPSFSKKEV
jgi:hypothetical protein